MNDDLSPSLSPSLSLAPSSAPSGRPDERADRADSTPEREAPTRWRHLSAIEAARALHHPHLA